MVRRVHFGITLKESEQGDYVRRESSTISKTMLSSALALKSTSQRNESTAQRVSTVFALAIISSVAGMSLLTSSAKASTSYMVYGPDGSSSYCTSYVDSGGSVYCY